MSDQKEYYEFLNAYTFGCLDSEDLEKLKKYLDEGGDFPMQELGEFQNLSSLLPSILAIESPRPEAKDTVARKLYRIKGEIKARRDKLKREESIKQPEEKKINENLITEEEKVKQNEEEETKKKPAEDFEIVKPLNKNADILKETNTSYENLDIEPEEDTPKTTAEDEIDTISDEYNYEEINKARQTFGEKHPRFDKYEEEPVKQKNKILPVIIFILFIAIIAAAVIAYFKVNNDVKDYQAQINSLNKQVTQLTERFKTNKELEIVLSSQNLKTVNLQGTRLAQNSYGRLFINGDTGKGYIQVSNMPAIQGNYIYTLWIRISKKYYSLAKFSTTDNLNYVQFNLPLHEPGMKAEFIVTSETAGGKDQPGKAVYLTGYF